jgi:hypothetical protein
MKDNARRAPGRSSWNRLGSAMVAILPQLDDGIRDAGGSLCIWWPLVGESDRSVLWRNDGPEIRIV